MTDLPPLPAPRPTLTHPGIIVSAPDGYRPLQMDLHVPAGDGPFPVVLWIHGGAFQYGSRVNLPDSVVPYGFHGRMIARGYAVADVDYRLAAEAQYPAQLTDVQSAVRWLRRHAAALNLDAGRFAALGESAGAHLAAMAGLLGGDDTALAAVIAWYGVFDFTALPDADDAFGPIAALLGGPVSSRMDFARSASPLHRVHVGAPPFLSVHGTADTTLPYEESERLTAVLREHGVRADLRLVPGADHCFIGCDDIGGLIDAGIDFLDDVLKPVR